MTITKRKILLGCLGLVVLVCCGFFAFFLYCVSTFQLDPPVEHDIRDPKFRAEIKKWFDLEFPDSVEWEKSEYRVWQDPDFDCVFTLPQKDFYLMFPPELGSWQENNHDMLPYTSKEWLKGKALDHFKVMKYEPKPRHSVTVVVDNPPGADENQRVWVYIHAFGY